MTITKLFVNCPKMVSKMVFMGTLCCGLALGVSQEAQADIQTVAQSEVVYLQNAYFLKDIENDLNRYKVSMIVMSHTNNRDDFLINRDELWGSREELSFAISNLQEYTRAPYYEDGKVIAEKLQELLLNCENYANNQNMLIASYNKIKAASDEVYRIFTDIKTAEQVVGQHSLDDNEQALYNQMINARTVYETLLTSYLNAVSSAEVTEIVPQLQKAWKEYNEVMTSAVLTFTELHSSFDTADGFFKSMFTERGWGNEYYRYIQSKEQQNASYAYFMKTYSDVNKLIKKIQVKLRMRVNF